VSAGAPTGVLFVCLGNICRSPLAEAVFIHQARARGVLERFDVDSCGMGAWHAGECADPRSIGTAQRYRVPMDHVARQLDPRTDFERFHHLIAMDRSNLRAILGAGSRHGLEASRVRLLRSFDPALRGAPEHELEVPDPYYGGDEGFDTVYRMVDSACAGLLDHLLAADARNEPRGAPDR
jgi:protein-tyrosine phosphatase